MEKWDRASRFSLGILVLLIVLLTGAWLIAALGVATSEGGACDDSQAADLGFVAAGVGALLATGALVSVLVRPARRLALPLVAGWAILLATWVAIVFTCG